MHMTKIVALLLLMSILSVQCKKEHKAAIDVFGITETDLLGNSTGNVDNTDWIKDNVWTDDEMKLFETPTSSQLAGTETATISAGLAYPNPAGPVFTLYFNASATTLLEIVITDKFLTVKFRHFVSMNMGGNTFKILLDPGVFENNTNYRVYYAFYSAADGQFYKGHGDIKISR